MFLVFPSCFLIFFSGVQVFLDIWGSVVKINPTILQLGLLSGGVWECGGQLLRDQRTRGELHQSFSHAVNCLTF